MWKPASSLNDAIPYVKFSIVLITFVEESRYFFLLPKNLK